MATELSSLKEAVDRGFESIHTRLNDLEHHVKGAPHNGNSSDPSRSLIVTVKDLRRDVDDLQSLRSRAMNFLIVAGLGAVLSVGAGIKAVIALFSPGK